MELPYPGYSWQFTQHEVALDAKIIYDLLACASYFEGQARVGQEITSLMVSSGLLTENVRDGRADAWRDYQQILPELGLIVSTKVSPAIRLTDIGKLYLCGGIGFSELVTIQALRYQYPNGHKTQLSSRLQSLLSASGASIPSSVMELQAETGVLIKPGLLILRVLLELSKHSLIKPSLNVDEVELFLLPIKRNSDWPLALNNLLSARGQGASPRVRDILVARNIRAWFRLLGKSDLFECHGTSITLQTKTLLDAEMWKNICEEQEDPSSFWIPMGYEHKDKLSWFESFGRLDTKFASYVIKEGIDEEYLNANYAAGTDLDENLDHDSGASFATDVPAMVLSEVTSQNYGSGEVNMSPQQALENIRKGAIKRKVMSDVHDQIVHDLATEFKNKGADVKEDRNSADLFVTWKNSKQTIFEVKTVSPRSLPQRLRSCVGQVLEYGYRHSCSSGNLPEMVAVLNLGMPADAWQVKYLNEFLDIGLLCREGNKNLTYPGSRSGSVDCEWRV